MGVSFFNVQFNQYPLKSSHVTISHQMTNIFVGANLLARNRHNQSPFDGPTINCCILEFHPYPPTQPTNQKKKNANIISIEKHIILHTAYYL